MHFILLIIFFFRKFHFSFILIHFTLILASLSAFGCCTTYFGSEANYSLGLLETENVEFFICLVKMTFNVAFIKIIRLFILIYSSKASNICIDILAFTLFL